MECLHGTNKLNARENNNIIYTKKHTVQDFALKKIQKKGEKKSMNIALIVQSLPQPRLPQA